jgi:hypothetical protein
LVDVQLLGALAELHHTLGHLAACGQGVERGLGPSHRDQGEAGGQGPQEEAHSVCKTEWMYTQAGRAVSTMSAVGFALAAGVFAHSHQRTVSLGEDGFEAMRVHDKFPSIVYQWLHLLMQ